MIKPRRHAAPAPLATGRRYDLAAFLEASRAASSTAGLERSLDSILDSALRLLNGNEGSVMLLEGEELRIVASRGIPAEIRREVRVKVGEGIAGTVVQTGQPLLLPTAFDVSRFEGFIEKTRAIHSAVCVPLRARDRVIGVLNINLSHPTRQFDHEDVQVAALFAEHAALAVTTADLLARAERNARELETLRGASTRLGRSLKLDTVADSALTEALAIAGSAAGLVCLSSGGRITLARYRGLSRDGVREVLRSPGFGPLVDSGEAVTVARAATDSVFAPLAPDLGNAALVAVPLRGSDGEPGGLLAVALAPGSDTSAARMLTAYGGEAGLAIANAALHEQVRSKEEELETIVDAITRPIVLIDGSGAFRAINPAAAETFSLAPEFEIGQTAAGKLGASLEELLFGQSEGTREVVLPVGGEPHVWRATVSTTRSDAVQGGRLLVLEDVTLQRELEQRKADFLAVIGHELRTPLTIIRGFASTLARRDPDLTEDARSEALGTIVDQSGRLERMIEDLLYVSRIENRTPPLHLAWEDAVAVGSSVIEQFRDRSPDRAFSMRTSSGTVQLLFDRVKVEQVLRHLLENAVKYSEADAPVLVRLDEEAEEIRFTVEDKGIGMFSGDIPRLFRVFGQLDPTSTRRYGGTGVGLSVCKTLVEAMGGRIWAQSMLGRGSEFFFTVPKTPPASERA